MVYYCAFKASSNLERRGSEGSRSGKLYILLANFSGPKSVDRQEIMDYAVFRVALNSPV